ncbi:MAG: glutathione S-transferase family protein [Gammaproteobacteria bacterium]|nr:glutathione S-transferase family protein [Gammaproteobacteria bacterium]MBI5615725.1 glutathione S-transferase family protein [Gammaproteobacteria bacterium]
MTARTLYDLAGADAARRFSPYCWRAKLALGHKGLPFDTVPWRFTEKDAIAMSGQGRVPVLVDGERVVHDSWRIACHLEEAHADRPSLFGGTAARDATRFLNQWTDGVLHLALLPILMGDLFGHVHEQDRDYFRATREERFGRKLEEIGHDREQAIATFQATLAPLRATLEVQPFLGGDTPRYGDYIVLGAFLWARGVSPIKLLETDDPIAAWRDRVAATRSDVLADAVCYPW